MAVPSLSALELLTIVLEEFPFQNEPLAEKFIDLLKINLTRETSEFTKLQMVVNCTVRLSRHSPTLNQKIKNMLLEITDTSENDDLVLVAIDGLIQVLSNDATDKPNVTMSELEMTGTMKPQLRRGVCALLNKLTIMHLILGITVTKMVDPVIAIIVSPLQPYEKRIECLEVLLLNPALSTYASSPTIELIVESLKTAHNIKPAAKQQQYKAQVIKLLNQCIKGTIRNSRAVIDTLKRLAIDDMSDDVVTAGVMNALHRLEINADCAAHFTRALIGIIDAVNVHMCQGSMKTMLLERGFLALTRNCVIRCNHVNLNEKILQLLAKELQADTNEQLIFVVLQGMLELGTHDSYLGKPTKHLGAKAVVEMIEKVNKNETMDPFLRQEILKLSLQTFKSEMIVSKMDKKRFLQTPQTI